MPVSDPGVLDRPTTLQSSATDSLDAKRLERDCRRLAQARASLERLYLEMRQDLQEAENRNACATVQIRLLLRDAKRRDREFASARRRIRILSKDSELRDREIADARRRIKLLVNDAERRGSEYANARRHIRLLLRDAERRDREFAAVRAQLRRLTHLSAGLATGFLAATASWRWRVGDALLSLPSRVLGRRPTTVADDQRPLATILALGQMPPPADPPDQDNVDRSVVDQQNRQPKRSG